MHPDTPSRLESAIKDAKEFIERGEEFLHSLKTEKYGPHGMLSASMKRKSMDLTRSLAQVRKEHR